MRMRAIAEPMLSDRTKARIVMAFTFALIVLSVVRNPSGARAAVFGHGAKAAVAHSTPKHGILVLLHGCSHSGDDWHVLPEEIRIVALARARGLVPVAPTSLDRDSGCWDSASTFLVVRAVN